MSWEDEQDLDYFLSFQHIFWRNVEKGGEDECWNWIKAVGSHGYGEVRIVRKSTGKPINEGAHRYSFILHGGYIEKGKRICHTCDNKRCCNPKHLWKGTQTQNLEDMHKKGRARDYHNTSDQTRRKMSESAIIRFSKREEREKQSIAQQARFARERRDKSDGLSNT